MKKTLKTGGLADFLKDYKVCSVEFAPFCMGEGKCLVTRRVTFLQSCCIDTPAVHTICFYEYVVIKRKEEQEMR